MSVHYHVCHECDELSKISTPDKPGQYRCPNCGTKLYTYKPGMIEKIYAYNIAALILFLITNYFPFLSFEAAGNRSEANFATSIHYLFENQEWLMGALILLTIIVVPLTRIVLNIFLFGSLYHNHVPRYAIQMIKLLEKLFPWGMLDVFLLGVLVSIVKLVKMGTIIPGISLWSFMLMVFIIAAGQSIFDPHQVWVQIEKHKKRKKVLS